ncbi:hypothetical protein AURANDRAFT_64600 [Aureococcus anophagefferens]|uniref:CSC1/OSCA1-like cytosolic domain-containing protein n=1 Tax=Aureococcus anophagefferens TaxID=44056 RepID=F0YAR7_AURAN|nr:hypothetical protein AURANDRAFT_64600 [Aureococcus anophagefferens]EGB07807.1 hypothetical protein AURANDRAFT_64600 [Aureococcus anophagefferens]|eukprot:XP_009037787.1 hypothetical protein AURANDRAFT_64600 [Aureococcus anophagefferens]
MGEMGVGMELYFFMTRQLAMLFSVLTLVHLPALAWHARLLPCRSGGAESEACECAASVANILLRMALSDGCPEGMRDVAVAVGGLSVNLKPSPKAHAAVICATQLLTACLVHGFTRRIRGRMSKRLQELQLQHATASQYSVLVTGLPGDTEEQEVLRHFHRRYDLRRPQVAYPIYGLNVRGACLLSAALTSSAVFVVCLALAVWLDTPLRHEGGKLWLAALGAAFGAAALAGCATYSASYARRLGRPVSVPPLAEEHGAMVRRARQGRRTCGGRRGPEKISPSMAWTVRVPDPRPVREEDHRSDRERRRPKRHSGDGSYGAASAPAAEVTYLGKWVADVSLVRSNGELIRQYMAIRNLWSRVQISRASVRRWSEVHGPHPHTNRCRKALNQLEVLVEKMKEAQRELSRSVDRKGIDEVTGAFVTFEHEWSAFRCAQDYAHSRYAFLRHSFQPLNLRLHRRAHFAARQKARRREQDRQGPLRSLRSRGGASPGRPPSPGDDVEAEGEAAPGSASMRAVPLSCRPAAAPDDVLWENLGVPSYVKNLRRAGTLFLSAVMLAGTSSLVRYKIRVMAEVVRPETSTCREAIAAHLGRYYDNETCAQVDRLYTNRSFQCPGPREDFLGHRDVDYGVAAPRGRACRGGSCVAPRSALAVPGSNATVDRSRFWAAPAPAAYVAPGSRNLTLCDSPCQDRDAQGRDRADCDALACGVAAWRDAAHGGEVCSDRDARRTRYSRNDLVECYCDREVRCKEQRLLHFERLMLRYAWTHAARKFLGRSKRLFHVVCREHMATHLGIKWIDRALVLVVVAVNSLFQVLFAAFAKVERHDSISTQLVNTAWKTFFLIFLNTAFLVPVFNMKCEPTWRGDLGLTDFFCEHVFIGEYVGFTKSWYENVGRTVVLSVALNMVVSVLSRFGTVSLLDPLVAWCWRDGCVTQTQLNELFQPRRFDIEYRYSFALTYVLCALVYCSGLPVLVPLTAAYFWASYVADRYLVMRLYAKPPSYDHKLPKLLLKVLPFASVAHLVMAMLMLSNSNLVRAGSLRSSGVATRAAPRTFLLVTRALFGRACSRRLANTAVAPLLVAVAYLVVRAALRRVVLVYNLELLPVLPTAVAACRRLAAGAARACRRGGGGGKVVPARLGAAVAPGDAPPNTAAWRRTRRCMAKAALTTRPGFTEPFRCVAPEGVSHLTHGKLERLVLSGLDGGLKVVHNSLVAVADAGDRAAERRRSTVSGVVAAMRRLGARDAKTVPLDEAGGGPNAPDGAAPEGQHSLRDKVRESMRRRRAAAAAAAAPPARSPKPRKSPLRRASESLKLTPVDGARSVLFGAKRWTEQHSKQAILEGWRLLDAAAATPGLVELQRVHSARRGLKSDVLMRTWEIIVEEKRLASYDIMANPRYRLALEFLESVGTFRPKRELVKEIGVFREQVVQLKDRCNRENLERRLTTKVHEIRLEVVRRQEAVKNVVDALVARVEARDVARRAEARVAAARLRLARAAALHLSSEVGAAARGLVDAVERRVLYGEALGRSACEACLRAAVAAVETRVVREAAADAAARDGARAAADRLVAAVEARSLAATLDETAAERDAARRKARDGESARLVRLAADRDAAARRAEDLERALAESRRALDDSRTLVASYERVAKITEAAAEREAKANRTVVEALERENRRVHEAWGDARAVAAAAPPARAAGAPPALALPPRPATDVEATQTTARSEPAPARDTREEQAQTDLHLDAVFESHRSSMTAAEEAIEAAEHAERATRREADEAQARVLAAEAEAARALRDATEARADREAALDDVSLATQRAAEAEAARDAARADAADAAARERDALAARDAAARDAADAARYAEAAHEDGELARADALRAREASDARAAQAEAAARDARDLAAHAVRDFGAAARAAEAAGAERRAAAAALLRSADAEAAAGAAAAAALRLRDAADAAGAAERARAADAARAAWAVEKADAAAARRAEAEAWRAARDADVATARAAARLADERADAAVEDLRASRDAADRDRESVAKLARERSDSDRRAAALEDELRATRDVLSTALRHLPPADRDWAATLAAKHGLDDGRFAARGRPPSRAPPAKPPALRDVDAIVEDALRGSRSDLFANRGGAGGGGVVLLQAPRHRGPLSSQ